MKLDLKELIAKLTNTPMVIEEGSTGSNPAWSYRKWSTGVAECWGRGSFSVSYSGWGSLYSSGYGQWNYPSNLFIAEPVCTVSPIVGNGDAWIYGSGSGTKDKTTKVAYIRPTSAGSGTGYVAIYSVGKWK